LIRGWTPDKDVAATRILRGSPFDLKEARSWPFELINNSPDSVWNLGRNERRVVSIGRHSVIVQLHLGHQAWCKHKRPAGGRTFLLCIARAAPCIGSSHLLAFSVRQKR
jgi:hypothetical protein